MTENMPPMDRPPRRPADSPPAAEKTIVSNRFGTVTNLAVHYNVRKLPFAGTHKEDLTMRHVVAARLDTYRHIILGSLLSLIGLVWSSAR